MTKILFFIHDLGHGGAEKVLVNLVNNMSPEYFDITVMALFGGGVNAQFLKQHIHYQAVFKKPFPGNSHLMKLFSPKRLHKWFIKEHYDIEIAYLEGPDSRIISGCPNKDTKRLSWIHCTMNTAEDTALGFRSTAEASACYSKMDAMVFVSETNRDAFLKACPYSGQTAVLYNTNESEKILVLASEDATLPKDAFHWCGVGKVVPVKGFDRMIRIQQRLIADGYYTHLCILGEGAQQAEL